MLRIETKFEMVNSWLKEEAESSPFCQSFDWEEILSREGKKIERLAVFNDEKLVAVALVQYQSLLFGWQYAFCPKGPVFVKDFQKGGKKEEVFSLLAEYLKNKKCVFFRFEPNGLFTFSAFAWKIKKTIDVNPRATMILDLRYTPEDLLAGMSQKTRYNIHLAERKNLTMSDDKNADLFVELTRQTAKRDKFHPHSFRHYHEVIFSPFTRQLTLSHQGKPVASAVFVGFGETFTYLYGASDYEYRSLMAPYLIQWEGIKMGQRAGYKYYDFFGVAPKKEIKEAKDKNAGYIYDTKHQYAGVTRFKQGFGGQYHEVPGTFDMVVSPFKYDLYKILRFLRRLI